MQIDRNNEYRISQIPDPAHSTNKYDCLYDPPATRSSADHHPPRYEEVGDDHHDDEQAENDDAAATAATQRNDRPHNSSFASCATGNNH